MLLGRPASAEDGTPPELPAVIDEVRIHATAVLWHTRTAIIVRELPWKEGDRVTPDAWELGIARLWNCGLFSQINAKLVHEGSKLVAVFDLEERLTLNPLLKFAIEGGGSGILPQAGGPPPTYWFHVGADDTNLFGEFFEGGFTYEQFGPSPGGRVWFHDPRLLGKRLDGWFEVNYLARPRPGFILFRGTARAQVSYEINDTLVVLGRVDGIIDTFKPPVPGSVGLGTLCPDSTSDCAASNLPAKAEGAQISASIKFGRVDTNRLLQKGWTLELEPLLGATTDPNHPVFVQGFLQFLGFIPYRSIWNFCLRFQAGIESDAPQQDRWYLGGLGDQDVAYPSALRVVRGLPDNAITTNAFGAFNAEIRVTAFDSTWVALVPAAFIDGVLAEGNGPQETSSGPMQAAVSFGAGIRILVPRFVGTGLRLDAAYAVGSVGPSGLEAGKPAVVTLNDQAWYSIGVFQTF